jgi:adenosylcobyric acid synthase
MASRYEFIILEGAGSPVEMNLKDGDIANLKMAEIADAACVLVADIDRGGVFASLTGTYELLTPEERARFGGFVINKFRGDIDRFQSGVDFLEERLKQPCLGIIPYLPDLMIDEEDGVSLDDRTNQNLKANLPPGHLRICVIQLPHISNFSDFESLKSVAGVTVFYARTPPESSTADVLIIPGSKNTIADLLWLRASGWDVVVTEHAKAERPVIGICGGFQMLGREVHDPYHMEGDTGRVRGLGLLDITTSLGREKVTRQARATIIHPELFGQQKPGPSFEGYEIHLGETQLGPHASPFLSLTRLGAETSIHDGAISSDGRVMGTYLHGLFDSVEGLTALLEHLFRVSKKNSGSASRVCGFDRRQQYDKLAAHFRQHLEMKEIYRLITDARS